MSQLNNNNNINKTLKDSERLFALFKEVKDIRYGRALPKEDPVQPEIKFNRIYVVDHRFNAVGAVLGILFVLIFFMGLQNNYSLASSERERVSLNKFETNNNPLDMMNIISVNMSELTTKEILMQEIEVAYAVEVIETDLLPKDEEKVIQEGANGIIEKTLIRTYSNGTLIEENVINEYRKTEPITKKVEKGTSEFLAEYGIHLGDKIYTKEDTLMHTRPDSDSDTVGIISQYIDLVLEEDKDDKWCRVSIAGLDGYIKKKDLTTEHLTPGIANESRIKKIQLSVNKDMAVNKPSGLTEDDFKKIFESNSGDRYEIFKNNASFFYQMEQKYKVNGLFVAAIGIHESNWGTSTIAQEKRNLFGYGSYDASAYESSVTFESYQYGIELVTKALAKYYVNESGTQINDTEVATGIYYNGSTIAGVNVKYASDPEWANRVFEIMNALYNNL